MLVFSSFRIVVKVYTNSHGRHDWCLQSDKRFNKLTKLCTDSPDIVDTEAVDSCTRLVHIGSKYPALGKMSPSILLIL